MQIYKDLDDIAFICSCYKEITLLKYLPQSSDPYETTLPCLKQKKKTQRKRDKFLHLETQEDVFSSCLIFYMHFLMTPSSLFQPLYQCINSMLILAITLVLSPV